MSALMPCIHQLSVAGSITYAPATVGMFSMSVSLYQSAIFLLIRVLKFKTIPFVESFSFTCSTYQTA